MSRYTGNVAYKITAKGRMAVVLMRECGISMDCAMGVLDAVAKEFTEVKGFWRWLNKELP